MSHLTPVPSDPEGLRAFLAGLGQSRVDAFFDDLDNNPEVSLPAGPKTPKALTFKITLQDTKPPVWRRLTVAGNTTLEQLHDVLQTAMGWTDSHLHRFYAGTDVQGPYFVTDYDVEEGDGGTPETGVRLDQLLRTPGDRIRYEYDFGDGWDHLLRLEKVEPLPEDPRPRCTAGRLACPPEDVGGVWGYDGVAAWVRGGCRLDELPEQFESVKHAVDWLPDGWDPDEFDAAEVDSWLEVLAGPGQLVGSLRPELSERLRRVPPAEMATVAGWLAHARTTRLSPSDIDDLTRPHRILLEAIRHPVPLSTSGYLPPDVVRELWPRLDINPVLAGKSNRESNVRPLLWFRKAVQQAGLLHAQHGMLSPTVEGIRRGDDPTLLWEHLVARLPVGRSGLKRDVGWFTLLALAGGVPHNDVYPTVFDLCVAVGWADKSGNKIAYREVNELVWPTLSILVGPGFNNLKPWPTWVAAAAAATLFAD